MNCYLLGMAERARMLFTESEKLIVPWSFSFDHSVAREILFKLRRRITHRTSVKEHAELDLLFRCFPVIISNTFLLSLVVSLNVLLIIRILAHK